MIDGRMTKARARAGATPTGARRGQATLVRMVALGGLLAGGGCGEASPPDGAPGRDPGRALAADADGRYRAFADRIAAQLQAAGVPGGALGIVENGALVFATGLGVKRAGGERGGGHGHRRSGSPRPPRRWSRPW